MTVGAFGRRVPRAQLDNGATALARSAEAARDTGVLVAVVTAIGTGVASTAESKVSAVRWGDVPRSRRAHVVRHHGDLALLPDADLAIDDLPKPGAKLVAHEQQGRASLAPIV